MTTPLAELVENLARSGRFAFLRSGNEHSSFSWTHVDRVLVQNPDAWHRLDRRMRRQLSLAINSALIPSPRVTEDRGKWGGIRVSLERVHEALRDGSTLMINDVHALLPAIGTIAHEATARLCARVTVRAFASKSATPGFRSHIDLTDTVIVQTAGRKAWTIWEPTRQRPVKDDVIRHAPPATGPLWEGVLSQGDVLYVPAGWWHRPVGLGEPSLHLSIDIHRPLRWEVIRTGHTVEQQASTSRPSTPCSGDEEPDPSRKTRLVQWADLFEMACLGREGSFFDDPLDNAFASPIRLFRRGPAGATLEVDPSGRFSRADLFACLDQGGMVRVEHAERFLEVVAARVNEIAVHRGTRATAALAGRGGPGNVSVAGVAETELLLLQTEGCATWEVTLSSVKIENTVVLPGDTISVPRGAHYHSPPTQGRSMHVEIAIEPPAEVRARQLHRALHEMDMANVPIPANRAAQEPWLRHLQASLQDVRLDTTP